MEFEERYFREELDYLRQLSKLLATEKPHLARFLAEKDADPDIERLLEGVAFLTGNRALRSHWFVRENGTLLESSRGLSGIDEIKQLFGAKTLTVDTGADNAAGKLTFNIDGLARAIAPLRDACHWAGE